MTDKQALKEARRRWGKSALIEKRPVPSMDRLKELNNGAKWLASFERFAGKNRYTVGHILYGFAFEVCGHGLTWEEAFADSDKKAK